MSIWKDAISSNNRLRELSPPRSSYVRIYYEMDKRCEAIWLKQFLELCGFIVIDKVYSLENMKNHSNLEIDNPRLEPANIILLSQDTNKNFSNILNDLYEADFAAGAKIIIGSSKIIREIIGKYRINGGILFCHDLNYENGESLNPYAQCLMNQDWQELVNSYIKDDNQLAKSIFLIKNVFYNRRVNYSSFSSRVELLEESAKYIKNIINETDVYEDLSLERLYLTTCLENMINNAVTKDLSLNDKFWLDAIYLIRNANLLRKQFYNYGNKCDTITRNTNLNNNVVLINKLIIESLSNVYNGRVFLRNHGEIEIQETTDSTISNCLDEFKPQILAPTIDFLYFSDNFNRALLPAEKMIEYDPDNYLALFRLGFLYYKNGNIEKAIEFYNRTTDSIKKIDSNYLTPMEIIYYYNSIFRKIEKTSYKLESSSSSSMLDELYDLTCKLKEELLSKNGNFQNKLIRKMFSSSNSNLSFITAQDINTIIEEIIQYNIVSSLDEFETKLNHLKIKKK